MPELLEKKFVGSTATPNLSLSVIILTFNEEIHISRAIQSISKIASQVFVIDSFSTDRTVELATSLGATVFQHQFVNQAQQFQWALENTPLTGEWIMRIDADEVIYTDLAEEINSKLRNLPQDVVGVNLKRRHIFMDRWVKHGGRYPLVMLRIWRKGHGRVEDRWMDEHIVIWGGKTVTFDGGFADHNLNNLTFFTDKHNKYATREAIEIINHHLDLFPRDSQTTLTRDSTSLQASAKRFIKERIYNKIPFTTGALLYFCWRYFFRLGFLDGRSGLVYHFLQGYWYRFLVGAKLIELEKSIEHISDKQQIISELSRLTGYDLSVLKQ